ncbi:MAG: hypothetical protein R2761_07425 [Acidimicrobiales bacterium]
MDGSPERTATPLDEGAAALARYGEALTEAVEAALGPWMAAAVEARLPAGLDPGQRAEVDRALADAAGRAVADVGGRLRQLLALDLDDQWTNPLSIIRQAVAYPTAVLAAAGAPPVARDDTDAALHPDDVYGLVPLAFADLGPEVHERGLEWGAAKAHVHLTRRRAADAGPVSGRPGR